MCSMSNRQQTALKCQSAPPPPFKVRVHEVLLSCPVSQCARSRAVPVEKTAAAVTGATQRGAECEKSLALAGVGATQAHTVGFSLFPGTGRPCQKRNLLLPSRAFYRRGDFRLRKGKKKLARGSVFCPELKVSEPQV